MEFYNSILRQYALKFSLKRFVTARSIVSLLTNSTSVSLEIVICKNKIRTVMVFFSHRYFTSDYFSPKYIRNIMRKDVKPL